MIDVALLNPLRRLQALGQSIWLDSLERGMPRPDEVARLVEVDGIAGVTSSSEIFEEDVAVDTAYHRDIAELAGGGMDPEDIYLRLAIADVRTAAELLWPVFEATDGRDGFACLAVSPHLAHDTDGTIREARRLWSMVARPNAMVEVPATVAGVHAIRELIADGINVNATLVFGVARCRDVASAYLDGLRLRTMSGLPVSRVASVVSLFLRPIDGVLDPRLESMAALGSAKAAHLVGQVATSCAKLAYQRWRDLFQGESFAAFAREGARTQRLLWAGTSTGNAGYTELRYVDNLVGRDTITALPTKTVDAYRNHGRPRARLQEGAREAQAALANLASLGIDLVAVATQLEAEGIQKRIADRNALLASIGRKSEPADRRFVETAPQ